MHIYIPSKGRSHILHTIEYLKNCPHPVTMIISESEAAGYIAAVGDYVSYKIVPDDWRIADIRQWVVFESGEQYVCMMDDDLKFFERRLIEDNSLYSIDNINPMLKWIDDNIRKYAHCSISTREQNFQNSHNLEKYDCFNLETCRPYRIYAFDTGIIKGEELSFHLDGVSNTMDDFHMTLSLMELGYPNIVSFKYVHNQRGSDTVGGASSYRTLDTLKDCAIALQKAHPNFVKLVQKTTINSWGATKNNPIVRTDVNIQWKKSLGTRIGESKL